MAFILQLETATKQCSVALSYEGEEIFSESLLAEGFSHGEKLHLFIDNVLKKAKLKPDKLDAIAVSKGPGSFTGLRIGVAAAKGLCFALDLPLIAVNTLELMVQPFKEMQEYHYLLPMLDARRMEVYTSVYNRKKNQFGPTEALILSENIFCDAVGEQPCLVLGNGATKFAALKPKINAVFSDTIHYPHAKDISILAWECYQRNEFENLGLFEPFYLKDFQSNTKS